VSTAFRLKLVTGVALLSVTCTGKYVYSGMFTLRSVNIPRKSISLCQLSAVTWPNQR